MIKRRIKEIALPTIFIALGCSCSEKESNDQSSTRALPEKKDQLEEVDQREKELEEEKRKLAATKEAARIAEERMEAERKLAETKRKAAEEQRQRDEEERKRLLAEKKRAAEVEAARARLVGQSLPELEIRGGAVYKNVTISKVTAATLNVVHDAGAANIPFENLSDEWKEKVQYDPLEAEAFAAKREEEQKAYNDKVAQMKADLKAQKDAEKAAEIDAAKFEIPAEERELQRKLEKAISLQASAENEMNRLVEKMDRLTKYSANWNTADKQLSKARIKFDNYNVQVMRYKELLREKENARQRRERVRMLEERRREREAARKNR